MSTLVSTFCRLSMSVVRWSPSYLGILGRSTVRPRLYLFCFTGVGSVAPFDRCVARSFCSPFSCPAAPSPLRLPSLVHLHLLYFTCILNVYYYQSNSC